MSKSEMELQTTQRVGGRGDTIGFIKQSRVPLTQV